MKTVYKPTKLISITLPRIALLLSCVIMLHARKSSAQSSPSPLRQTFTTNPPPATELSFTSTILVGGTGLAGYYPETGGTTAGLGAYGVGDGNANSTATTVQLDFQEKTFQAASGTLQNLFSFDLASVAYQNGNGQTEGFAGLSKVEVYLDINRAGFPSTPQLKITGPSQNGPLYNFGMARTQTYDGQKSNVEVVSIGTPGGISTVKITLPTSATSATRVAARIVLAANNKNQLIIDNVALTSGNGTALPVELTSFGAAAKSQSVNLNWATASEKNSDRFEVQRSATGEAFETVGTVKGQGNTSSAHNYAFVDSRPLAGRSYYRLRQVDTDGTTAYSPVAAVQVRNELAVYPNPSAGIVTLPATLGDVHYRLLNTIGQTLLSGQATGNDQLDLTKLAKGTFFLELTGEAGRTTQRLVRE